MGTFIALLIRDIDIIILTQIDLFNGRHFMTGQPTPNSGAANRQNKIVSAAEAVSVIKNGSMIATGGFAKAFADHADIIEVVEPDLTLRGLRLLWEKNR